MFPQIFLHAQHFLPEKFFSLVLLFQWQVHKGTPGKAIWSPEFSGSIAGKGMGPTFQISLPQFPTFSKMAAVFGRRHFRALVVEKGFVINILQRLITPVRMHLHRRVCFKSVQIQIQRRSVSIIIKKFSRRILTRAVKLGFGLNLEF